MNSVGLYLASVLGIFAMIVGSLVTLEIMRPEGFNQNVTQVIIGSGGTIVTVLLSILKSANNGAAIEECKQHAVLAATKAEEVKTKLESAPIVPSEIHVDATLHAPGEKP